MKIHNGVNRMIQLDVSMIRDGGTVELFLSVGDAPLRMALWEAQRGS